MTRPLSPALSSVGEPHSTPSSAARRLVRQLVVDAEAHSEGVTATLYCKVVLPSSSSPSTATHHLLSLVPLSALLTSSAYTLPLRADDAPAAHAAARRLGLGGAGAITPDGERRVRRRSSAASDLLTKLNGGGEKEGGERRSAEVREEEGEVLLVLAPPAGEADGERPVSPGAGGAGSVEFVVLLEIEARFGALKLPRFANSITIPTPLCLRSELFFTLPAPPPSSPSPNWDLSIRPSLSAASSSDHPGSTQITGSFPSSSALSLRWAPQLPAGAEAPLVVPHAALETKWTLDEYGAASAHVHVEGAFELAGLREKAWVELALGEGALPEVVSCEGEEDTPVLAYELLPASVAQPVLSRSSTATSGSSASHEPLSPAASPLTRPLPRELDDFASPLDESLLLLPSSAPPTSYPFTPTPPSRRRPPNPRAAEPRPPSFTSLFDTAPPAPPVLDTSFAEMQPSPGKEERRKAGRAARERGLSLMKTPAPFDPEASAMDMSFEVSALEAGAVPDAAAEEASEPPSPAPPAPVTLDPVPALTTSQQQPQLARFRVQLDLASALRRFALLSATPDPSSTPTFAFFLVLSFPAPALRTSSGALALPPFALPVAEAEDALVLVAPASRAWRVEVISSAFDPAAEVHARGGASAPPSPLPAVGGNARWATGRAAGEKVGAPVDVELRSAQVEEAEEAASDVEEEAQLVDEFLELESLEAPAGEGDSTPDAKEADELPSLDQSIRTERPPSTPAPLSLASPPPASSAPIPLPQRTTSLSHVRVEVTPVPPSRATPAAPAPWRLHYRYVLAHPYTGSLRAPPTPKALRCWSADGGEVEPRAEGPLGLVVEVDGVKEVVYEVQEKGEKARGAERVRVELLALEAEVAKLEVVVAVPQGFTVEFADSSDAVRTGTAGSATFTRFDNAPGSAAPLELVVTATAPAPLPPPTVPAPAPNGLPRATPSSSASPAPSPLRTLLSQAAAILLAFFLYQGLSRAILPPPPSSPAVTSYIPSSLPTSTSLLPAITSILRTPITHTTTSTATVQRISTSTVVVTSTQHHTSISTATATSTRTVTLILSPSSSPSPRPTFVDDFSPSPVLPSATPVPTLAPALHSLAYDTAQDLRAAFRVWVERAKLRARRWLAVLRGWVQL
ncbi:hypothetical protein JCM10450v2_002145 [Rhodotorula kratochvilovae]